MNRYIYIFLFLCVFTISVFAVFEAAGLSLEGLLENRDSQTTLALISVGILGIDVILPIPSSVVMIGNGLLFGFVWGALLSVTGGLISSILGYYIGKKAQALAKRFTSPAEEERARQFLEKYGYTAIIASRPIPVLAESVAIISGALHLSLRKVIISSIAGLLPISFIYSATGAYSASFDSGLWAFVLSIGMAALFWFISTAGIKKAGKTGPES
jgi:uncharacterized membrane protein YdjX (TVP38/TMEM64 family)